ncbi:MAG: cyclic nucleotide-binding domain-containing protein [Phycisphaeraceae bacterium]
MALTQFVEMKKPSRWDEPFAREPLADEQIDRLLTMEPFAHMDASRFPPNLPLSDILRNDTRIVNCRRGDVVVRQGDYGNSVFLVLKGALVASLEPIAPSLLGRKRGQRRGWLGTAWQMLTKPRLRESRDTAAYPQFAKRAGAADSSGNTIAAQDFVNLLEEDPDVLGRYKTAPIEAGHMFGELGALGRIPRTATVLADSDAQLLEIRWQGLRDLRRHDEALRDHVDRLYRRFGLLTQLRQTPCLAHLNESELAEVVEAAEFDTYGSFEWYGTYRQLREESAAGRLQAEPMIAEQGHHPNGLILIRAGFARLSRQHGTGEQTLSYLTRGQAFGLGELLHNHQQDAPRPYQCSLRAVGYTDIIRISTHVLERLVFPRADPGQLEAIAPSLATPARTPMDASVDPQWYPPPEPEQQIEPGVLDSLVEQRLINGTATMLIDMDRCTRCDQCVQACADGHSNNPRFLRHGTVIDHYMVANACMHCADPVCMIGCPTGAIHRDAETGNVEINDRTCIGCSTCANNCPYDNIRMVEIQDQQTQRPVVDPDTGQPIVKATKCDLCTDQMGGPACQRACPHDALVRMDMQDIPSLSQWMNR